MSNPNYNDQSGRPLFLEDRTGLKDLDVLCLLVNETPGIRTKVLEILRSAKRDMKERERRAKTINLGR